MEGWRAERARQHQQAYARNPDQFRAYSRKSYEKRKQDPAAYQEYLDRHRMNYRLRQERNGRSIEDIRQYKPGRQPDPYLPAAPMQDWIERKAEQHGGILALAQKLQCDEASLRRDGDRVRLSKVDRLLTREGSTLIHDIYSEDQLP